ncbi:MAG TPA: hypothetical protein VFQ51_02435 [Vicinamibacteria bacterium]|nr:hypothetical protein [Vicinamibacteria bacterium]
MRARIAGAVVLAALSVACEPARRSTDPDFILLESQLSPSGRFRLVKYHYDIGALGYSRGFAAVTRPVFEGLNLRPYEIPDGYLAEGWSTKDELLLKTWKPYYDPDNTRTLTTGDELLGVRVVIVGALDQESFPR